MDPKTQNINTEFLKYNKLSETIELDKLVLNTNLKLLPAIDKNDRVIKKQLEAELVI